MNVLVAGGAGYIGSICVQHFLNAGHKVTVLDDLSEGHLAAIDRRAEFIHLCLADAQGTMDALRKTQPEAVLHFAASALVGESMKDPAKYFRNNVGCGQNLLDAAMAVGVRKFVFSSTCASYGVPQKLPISEESPQNPINPYGESKRLFERMLHWYQECLGLQFVVFRYFNAAGATQDLGEHHRIETHLIPNILKVPLGQNPHCTIFGTDYPTPDGTCVRDYVHVEDLASAHLLACESKANGFFNLGIGAGVSVRETIAACQLVSGRPIRVVEEPRRPGDPPTLVASAEKARRELGWEPRFKRIEDIVASAWNWHLKNPHGYPR